MGYASAANVDLVKSLGAEHVIDYSKEDFTKTENYYHIIFDAVGKSSFSRCTRALTDKGVYLTMVPTPSNLFPMAWTKLIGQKKAKFAATGLRATSKKVKDLVFMNELIEHGKYVSVIDRHYPLEQIREAHSYVEKGHKKGNVVITL
nr:zinc-binding dehydrogenase [Halobacillus alkaliphilus]